MNNWIKVITISIIALAATSCSSSYYGEMHSSTVLSQANFSYVQLGVSGNAEYKSNWGKKKPAAIVAEAKKDLLNKHALQDNQALVNITVSWKKGSYRFFSSTLTKCTVSADIVEFK